MPLPSIVQQASSASSAAAPASFTTAAFTATQAGSMLVAVLAAATSGAWTVTNPAGFTQAVSGQNAGNTLAMRMVFQPNVSAGITTINFPSLTAVNGVAVAVYELANMQPVITAEDGNAQGIVNSSTAVGPRDFGAGVTFTNEVVIAAEADLTGQAFTNTSSTLYTAGTTATSTLGATNVIIRPFSALLGPARANGGEPISGTLAGALANGVVMASFQSNLSSIYSMGPGGANMVTEGAGYAVGI